MNARAGIEKNAVIEKNPAGFGSDETCDRIQRQSLTRTARSVENGDAGCGFEINIEIKCSGFRTLGKTFSYGDAQHILGTHPPSLKAIGEKNYTCCENRDGNHQASGRPAYCRIQPRRKWQQQRFVCGPEYRPPP